MGILKDIRFQGAVGGILLIIGLYVGWMFLPEGTGKFQEPFQQLTAIYKEVETKAGSSPSEGDWKEFGQETEPKIKAVKDKLSEMKKSQHLVKGKLNSLAGQLIMLLRKKPDEVENSLKAAKRLQGEAAKMLGVSP